MNNTTFVDSILNSAFSGLTVSNTDNIDNVADMLDKYRLRWTVKKEPLQLPDGIPSGFHGVVRQDTRKTLATCKEGYETYQNAELAELLLRICERTGYNIYNGGSFNGGAKVFLQLETDQIIKGLGDNKTTVKGYVTGINSHDLSTGLNWGCTNETLCCENQFSRIVRSLKHKFRHTVNMRDKIEESLKNIDLVEKEQTSIFDKFIKLAERPVKKDHIAQIVKSVTKVDINKTEAEAEKDYSTYARNRTTELLTSISKEMSYKGETLWGLFSGVTHYTSHVLPVPKRDNARKESKYTGGALTVDNEAFTTILSLK
jgi:phage/plasmid-like protein (TIGR03299 family)